jgi:hypothetical protein
LLFFVLSPFSALDFSRNIFSTVVFNFFRSYDVTAKTSKCQNHVPYMRMDALQTWQNRENKRQTKTWKIYYSDVWAWI